MLKYFFCFLTMFVLSGCKLITDTHDPLPSASIEARNIDSSHCELPTDTNKQITIDIDHVCNTPTEGVNEIIHPMEDLSYPQLLPSDDEISNNEPQISANLWQHIAENLQFAIPNNQPRLEAQKNWYLKYPNYMQRVSDRAAPFLYYIVSELEKHNLPLDLALLPIVESAFDPFAYSHGRAAGMWQFIPETGKRFGMAQDWWFDGRRDVVMSTAGAIAYLQYLHEFFDGNWLHALAAYNSGEGRVKRAIRRNQARNKPTDFWSLDLPKETRAYVPKLLALADILKHHDAYGFDWPEIENTPVIDVVEIATQIDLAKAAEFSGLSIRELQALNPGFNRWATSPSRSHSLLLPIDKVEAFTTAFTDADPDSFVTWHRHKIRPGENLGVIAQKYSTTVGIIRQINRIEGHQIYAGKYLLIPDTVDDAKNLDKVIQSRIASMQSTTKRNASTHTVAAGDTLWDLANKYKISVNDLLAWNNMAADETLRVGKKLTILNPTLTDDKKSRRIQYNVRAGDSLSRIADKFNVRVSDIIDWNGLHGQKYLQPGQLLKLVVDITQI